MMDMVIPKIDPGKLVEAIAQVLERFPEATLSKNRVGNLSVFNGDDWVGFIDLGNGTMWWEDERWPVT